MGLILLAAAAWSIGIGLYRAFRLSANSSPTWTSEPLADRIIALSLVGAGLWAWESRSWFALLGGYVLGWAVLYLLPVPRPDRRSRRTA